MKRILLLLASSLLMIGCQKEAYHNITVSVNPAEGGSVSPSSGPVLDGTSVSFKATPKGDYVFTGWSGSISGTENPKTVTVTQDMNVTANFTLRSYPLTIMIEGEGTVAEKVVSTKSEYQSGTVVELTATPSDHWLFDHWEGDLTGATNPAQITVSSAKNVKAVFVEKTYPLAIEIVGQGTVNEEVITTKSTYQEGTVVKLTAVPDEFWKFDHWEGDIEGKDNPEIIEITSETNIVAIFKEGKYKNLAVDGTANCYLVNGQGYYRIPAVKGNSNEALVGADGERLIWETYNEWGEIQEGDLIKDLEYQNGYLLFYAPMENDYGNALIGVTDSDGNVLWSWHIWLCRDYDPIADAITLPVTNTIMMDRNIGASGASYYSRDAGMLYQWGRKDPFFISQWDWMSDNPQCMSTIGPSPVKAAEDIIVGDNNLEYSIAHPEIFITNEYSPYDWYAIEKHNMNASLWNENNHKTIYDPCPAGWKVPEGGPDGVWAQNRFDKNTLKLPHFDDESYPIAIQYGLDANWWDKEEKGRIYLPANNWFNMSGCKGYFNGKQFADGGYGAYWSNNTDDIFGRAMYFAFYGEVYPDVVNFRSYGYAVRCIKE